MFIFDVETLSKKSEAVILSMACIYFDPNTKPTYNELMQSAFFVKFDAADQIKRLHRKTSKSTIEWWSKQCEYVKNKSFKPLTSDVRFETGYELFRSWVKSKKDDNCWVWARGNLDQLVMDDIEEQIVVEPVFPYHRWRDVRTAVDFLAGTGNGYCAIPNFDDRANVIKHCPIHDCAFDAMMLMYGAK
jgi:hypothetical protein